MADGAKPDGKPGGGRRGGFLGGLISTLLVVAVILLAFGFFAARTAGFRDYAQDAIEKLTGARFVAGDSRIGWPYDLVLENVRLRDNGAAGEGGLEIRELRIGLCLDLTRRVEIVAPVLRMERSADGNWKPDLAAPLGALSRLGQVSELVSQQDENVLVKITRGQIDWTDERGGRLSAAHDFDLTITPLRVGERRMWHFLLSAREIAAPGGAPRQNVRWEWLATAGRNYIEIDAQAAHELPGPADTLWKSDLPAEAEGRSR